MTRSSSKNEVMRTMLFNLAETTIERLHRRVTDSLNHLKHRDALGVLGAVSGFEQDLARIRCLMSVAEDFGPKEKTHDARQRQ